MARRQLLAREALARHYDPPTDERAIARHFALSREDLNLVAERRGAPSRRGFAMMMLYLRWPGRVLEAGEKPPGAILAFVADQIGAERITKRGQPTSARLVRQMSQCLPDRWRGSLLLARARKAG